MEEGLPVPGHEPHDVQPLEREARQFPRGPHWLPGVGDGRDRGEARLVKIELIDPYGIGQLLQGERVLAFAHIGVRVAPALQQAAAAVQPSSLALFARAGGLAGGLLQGGLRLFDLARFLVDQCIEWTHLVLGVEGGLAVARQRLQPFGVQDC